MRRINNELPRDTRMDGQCQRLEAESGGDAGYYQELIKAGRRSKGTVGS